MLLRGCWLHEICSLRTLCTERCANRSASLGFLVGPALLGTVVGGVIVLTNSQTPGSTMIYAGIVIAWGTFVPLAWCASQGPEFVPQELETEESPAEARPVGSAE